MPDENASLRGKHGCFGRLLCAHWERDGRKVVQEHAGGRDGGGERDVLRRLDIVAEKFAAHALVEIGKILLFLAPPAQFIILVIQIQMYNYYMPIGDIKAGETIEHYLIL